MIVLHLQGKPLQRVPERLIAHRRGKPCQQRLDDIDGVVQIRTHVPEPLPSRRRDRPLGRRVLQLHAGRLKYLLDLFLEQVAELGAIRLAGRLQLTGQRPYLPIPLLQGLILDPQLQFAHDEVGQIMQDVQLHLGGHSGTRVNRTERSQHVPVGTDERCAGIKADARLPGHKRVVSKPGIRGGVFDHHERVFFHVVHTEGALKIGLQKVDAHARLEPLSFLVDQGHERNRDIQPLGHEPSNPVESLFGRRVQNIVPVKRGNACCITWILG